jgi:polysaccharide biosynthesis/export protein
MRRVSLPRAGVWIVSGCALVLAMALAGCGASLDEGSHLAAAPPLTDSKSGSAASDAQRAVVLKASDAQSISELTGAADPHSHAYRIGPLDVLDVTVFQVPDLSKTVQVASDGTIALPLVGAVAASGRTPREVEGDLTKRLGGKYLQSPQVNVYVKEYNSQRVTIDGSVKRPGVYPLRGPSTLLQTIATAEGFTDTADATVVVFRSQSGKPSTAAKFDVGEIRAGRTQDPQILQGDVVVVSNSTMKESYQALLKILPVTSLFVSIL